VIPLTRMRLTGYLRTGRVLPPALGVLLFLFLFHGGGKSEADKAYAVAALLLFPLLAWQTRMILDGEPNVQRRLAILAVGSARREQIAGLLASAIAGVAAIAVSMVLPWLMGAVKAEDTPLARQLAIGVWAHLLALIGALALGALASRAITQTTGKGVAVLAVGGVLAIVLGLPETPLAWLVPPISPIAKAVGRQTLTSWTALVYTGQTLVWTAVALGGYARLRRSRA